MAVRPRPFTREEYHRLAEIGVLNEDSQVELLEGRIVDRFPPRGNGGLKIGHLHLHRFTRDEYHRMMEAGLLGEDDRVELLEGAVLAMSPIGPHHCAVVDFLVRFFTRSLGDRAIVRVQSPIVLDDGAEPQPDLALLRPRTDFYRASHPSPADILLLIEVAESSTDVDLETKPPAYARGGVREYWVIDLLHKRVVVHRRPEGDRYTDVRAFGPEATVSPANFPDVQLPVVDCLA